VIRAYQGHFLNERFVPFEDVKIPEDVEVYVMITDKAIPSVKTKAQQQREAFEDFFSCVATITDEHITDEDIKWLENNRTNLGKVIDL